MPTTRRRRARQPATVTLRTLGIPATLELLSGWRPPRNAFEATRTAFSSYAQYLSAYDEVRDEMRARWPGESCFAEELHAAVEAHPHTDIEALGEKLYRRAGRRR
jgi:hypothetical protein